MTTKAWLTTRERETKAWLTRTRERDRERSSISTTKLILLFKKKKHGIWHGSSWGKQIPKMEISVCMVSHTEHTSISKWWAAKEKKRHKISSMNMGHQNMLLVTKQKQTTSCSLQLHQNYSRWSRCHSSKQYTSCCLLLLLSFHSSNQQFSYTIVNVYIFRSNKKGEIRLRSVSKKNERLAKIVKLSLQSSHSLKNYTDNWIFLYLVLSSASDTNSIT